MRFRARGETYEFSERTLTFAEARAIERVTGLPFDKLEAEGGLSMMQAMVWVAMKRTDPTLRYSDLDDMPLGEFEQLDDDEPPAGGPEGEADPTIPAGASFSVLTRKFEAAGVLDDTEPSKTTS